MKKIFLKALVLFFSSQLFAYNMDIPKRTFEIGMNLDVGVSNNYFAANEILVNDLVIDFTKISEEISTDGLVISTKEVLNTFVNLNLKNGWHFGMKNGFEGYGNGAVSKDLFDFLGKGNKLNESIVFETRLDYDFFYYTESSCEWNMFGFRFGVAPALYLPLMHVEQDKSHVSFCNNSQGNISADVAMGLRVFTSGSLEDVKNNSIDPLDWLNGGWGFDVNLSVEHRLTETLQGRAYMRLPVIPGSLKNLAETTFLCSYDAVDLVDVIKTGGSYSSELKEFKYSEEKKYICRPFRTGGEVNWRPFGEWMIFNGMLGFGVKYPWSAKAKAYWEYNLGVHTEIFKIIGFDLSSSYLNEIFSQRVGFMLNFRAVELDAGISLQGASFVKSWQGSGVGAYLGVAVGW